MTTRKTTTRIGGSSESAMSKEALNVDFDIDGGIGGYTTEERRALKWFWKHGVNDLNGSTTALCKTVNKDWTVLLKVFQGSYDAKIDNIIEAIKHLKKNQASGVKFIATEVTEKIDEALNYARDHAGMVTITGSPGRGKSHTAEHWASLNKGKGKYIRVLSKSSRRKLAAQICQACGISTTGKTSSEMEANLLKSLNFKTLLIFDEAGHMFPSGRASRGGCLEFIRDLKDVCGCGVAFIYTDVYLQEMKTGVSAAYLEQFVGRNEFEVTIPSDVLKSEVLAIVSRFRENPPNNILSLALKIARNRDGRLRSLFIDLQRAKAWAEKRGGQLSYEALKLASDWRLSGGEWSE